MNRALLLSEGTASLGIYAWRPGSAIGIMQAAALLGLPYDALATLNRAGPKASFPAGQVVLVPSAPGIFVPAVPESDFELLLAARRALELGGAARVKVRRAGRIEECSFLPGEGFNATERLFFLNILFRFPLPKAVVSSRFGVRPNPFGGEPHMHSGIDLAAPAGTDVLAAREGVVTRAGWDAQLGLVVVIAHDDGYSTVYGHLESISVALRERVRSAMIIGKVGSTGLSTGPHLHFEIRLGGTPKDPESLLPRSTR